MSPDASIVEIRLPDRSPEATQERLARIEVRDSTIAGRGVFALTSIPQGDPVAQYMGKLVDDAEAARRLEAGNVYIFMMEAGGYLDGDIGNNPAKYINHSCEPNCLSRHIDNELWVFAKRLIQPGEELSYDYGYRFTEAGLPPCHCGAPHCFRFILAENLRWPMPPALEG